MPNTKNNGVRRRLRLMEQRAAMWPNDEVRTWHIKRDALRGHQRRALRVLDRAQDTVPSTIIPRRKTWRGSLRGLIGR